MNKQEDSDSAVGQTGYALNALILVDEQIGGFGKAIEDGRKFLLQKAEKDGLWKYKAFLPADLDDTTAALAVLDVNNSQQEALRRKGVATILRLQKANGKLRTWLISDQTMATMRLNAAEFRIAEAHPEVMSYFFEYLSRWGFPEFQKNLDIAAQYVAQEQRTDGSWKTTWYRSDLYAVYRNFRFLASTEQFRRKYGKNLRAAKSFVLASQLPNGTWGKLGSSSAMDTALCIGLIGTEPPGKMAETERAIAYLNASQLSNGAWPSEPFFFLDISQRGKTGEAPVFIGNELYTTSIVVENLLLFSRSRNHDPQKIR